MRILLGTGAFSGLIRTRPDAVHRSNLGLSRRQRPLRMLSSIRQRMRTYLAIHRSELSILLLLQSSKGS